MKNNSQIRAKSKYLTNIGLRFLLLCILLTSYLPKVSAEDGFMLLQSTNVTLNLTNVSLETLFKTLERKSNYVFFFKENVLQENEKVTVKAQNESVVSILNRILPPRQLTYTVKGRQVIIVRLPRKEERKSELYSYISDDFEIRIKVAKDFTVEISQLVRNFCLDIKLNTAIKDSDIDLSKCESVKVENIKRKVKAVMGKVEESDEHYIELVNTYIKFYMRGIELMKIFSADFPEVYGDINELLLAYKKKVYSKTMFNSDKSLNAKIFNEILEEFGDRLEKEFKYLSFASVIELQHDMVAGWLADCSMEFR